MEEQKEQKAARTDPNDLEITIMNYLDKRLALRYQRHSIKPPRFTFRGFLPTIQFEIRLIHSYIPAHAVSLIPEVHSLQQKYSALLRSTPTVTSQRIEALAHSELPDYPGECKVFEYIGVVPETEAKQDLTCRNLIARILSNRLLYLAGNPDPTADGGEEDVTFPILCEVLVDDRCLERKCDGGEPRIYEASLVVISREGLPPEDPAGEDTVLRVQKGLTELESQHEEKAERERDRKLRRDRKLEKCDRLLQEINCCVEEVKIAKAAPPVSARSETDKEEPTMDRGGEEEETKSVRLDSHRTLASTAVAAAGMRSTEQIRLETRERVSNGIAMQTKA